MNYIDPKLQSFGELVKNINPSIDWQSLQDDTLPQPGDVIVARMDVRSEVYVDGTEVVLIPEDNNYGPLLAQLVERFSPQLTEASDQVLELAVEQLADQWDSEEDVQRFARLTLELWNRERIDYDRRWIHLAKLAWMFGFQTVHDYSGDANAPHVLLYEAMGYLTWGQFSMDLLNMRAAQASQLKWAWEIYHKKLGWSPEKMLEIGKAKLTLALGTLRDQMMRPDAIPEVISALLDKVSDPKITYAMLNDQLQSGKGNGLSIRFAREDLFDFEMVKRWLDRKHKPDMAHVAAWVDGGLISNALVIVFNPKLDAEMLKNIRDKMGKYLHWEFKNTNDMNVEELPNEEVDSDEL